MKANQRKKFPSNNNKLFGFFHGILVVYHDINRFFFRIAESEIYQSFLNYRGHIALFLYLLWLAGCGYWFYQLIIIDVRPITDLDLGISDPRDAVVIVSFSIFGFVFVSMFVFYIIKFIYNLFHGGIYFFFPVQWYPLVKSVSYLVILCFAFSFTANIKVAGLTAYNQVLELVNISRQHDPVIEIDTSRILEKIGRKVEEQD